MSLVGPRPALPREVDNYTQEHRRRLGVRPGLTCIWQVSGRGEVPFERQVQMDVEYVESHSFWLDVKLVVSTVPAVLSGRGAC
jgi:lipopolysaccharide/colanic/teichoic acid biosynthesis glycosyltransferase